MLSKARRCRTIALLAACFYYAMYLFQPFIWADSFMDAVQEGRAMGPGLLEKYAPGKIPLSNDTVPGYEDALNQKDTYTNYYTDPAGLSEGVNSDARKFVLDAEAARVKVNLENDTVFGYKCQEKDAAGKCIRWSSSKEIIASAYKDCEETIIPTYDEPPRMEVCTGQRTHYNKACLSMMYPNLTQETINQKCDTITLDARPGQIYARCKDYYDWYKESAGVETVKDDCNACGNRDQRYCFEPDSYINEPPPADATFFITQRQMLSCNDEDGWDNGTYSLTNWSYRYSHSRIERLSLSEDATCPDFDELVQSGKCVVEKMVQCNATGTACLTSIENFEYTGEVPPPVYSFKVPVAIQDTCLNKCNYETTWDEGGANITFLSCPVAETCTYGICTADHIIDTVPSYASELIGKSEIVTGTEECELDPVGTVDVVQFNHYRNGFPCKIIPGEIDNYEVCLYYDYLTVGDKSGAGQVTSSPAYNTWLAPFTISKQYFGAPPFEYSNQSLRGGSEVKTYRNVWQMRTDLNCNLNDNDCQPLIDSGCIYWSTECLNEECTERAFSYQCGGTGKVVSYMKGTTCAGEMKCQGTTCMQEIKVETGNIASAAAAAEILSNLRVDSTSTELFPGKQFECQNSPKNCCDDAVGGVSIGDYVEAASSMYTVGSAALETFAPEMYASLSQAATKAMAEVGIELSGETISATVVSLAMDVTEGVVTAVAGEAAGLAAAEAVGAVVGAICSVLWVLAVLYALYTILSFVWKIMMACDEEDMATSVKLTLKLCHLVGTKPEKALGMNLKNRSVYCCFNSILARLIHEQGRAQIGRSWGTPETPDCSGLTPGQMTEMDFSVMDFSEYMKYVKEKAGLTDEEQEATLQKAMNNVNSQIPPE